MAIYFYGCMSLDGYLADSQHGLAWLDQVGGSIEESSYSEFYSQMDVTIMGKKTFDFIKDMEGIEEFYAPTTNYVFTHEKTLPVKGYEPVQGSVVDFVKGLPAQQNVFVIGGNTLVAPLLEADLFDHLIIQVAPVLLGEGIPLFTQAEGLRFYELREVKQYGPFAELVYDRRSQ